MSKILPCVQIYKLVNVKPFGGNPELCGICAAAAYIGFFIDENVFDITGRKG